MSDKITDSLCALAGEVLRDIIETHSERHGGHAEWQAKPIAFHLKAVIGHANAADRQLAWYKGLIDGEDAEKHMKQAIVRSVMAYRNYLAVSRVEDTKGT
jgi:hypothetical protein